MIIKFRCGCDDEDCNCDQPHQKVDYEHNEKDVYEDLKKLSVKIGKELNDKNGSK